MVTKLKGLNLCFYTVMLSKFQVCHVSMFCQVPNHNIILHTVVMLQFTIMQNRYVTNERRPGLLIKSQSEFDFEFLKAGFQIGTHIYIKV